MEAVCENEQRLLPTYVPSCKCCVPRSRNYARFLSVTCACCAPVYSFDGSWHLNVHSQVVHAAPRDVVMMDDLRPSSVVQRTPGNAETGEGYSADIAFTTDGSKILTLLSWCDSCGAPLCGCTNARAFDRRQYADAHCNSRPEHCFSKR